MPEGKESRHPASFGFVGVHREGREAAAAWMRYVIGAAADTASGPQIHDVEDQRRMHWNGGMQTRRRLPRAIADPRDPLALHAGGMQRNAASVARDGVTAALQPLHPHLHSLH